MLRRFRKRRGGEPHDDAAADQGGGHDHEDDDIRGFAGSKPLSPSTSLDEDGQRIFGHVYDTERGRRHPHAGSGDDDENDPPKYSGNRGVLESIPATVDPKKEPPLSTSKIDGGGGSTTLAQQRRERAEQKPDHPSRRHPPRRAEQRQQRPNSQRRAKHPPTSMTADTLSTSSTSATTADASDASPPWQVRQQQRRSLRRQITPSVAPPLSTTRHPEAATRGAVKDVANVRDADSGLAATASSFGSSVHAEHDFRSLVTSASLESYSHDGGKMLHHENDYRPTPPSKRSERYISGWAGGRSRISAQAGERRRVVEKLKQRQERGNQKRQQEYLDHQKLQQQKEQKKKDRPWKEWQQRWPRPHSAIPAVEICDDAVVMENPTELKSDNPEGRAAALIDKDTHRGSKNDAASTKPISSPGDGANTSSTMPQDKSRSPPPPKAALVTPSPSPSKKRMEQEPDSLEKHRQRQQRSKQNEQWLPPSSKSTPPISTVGVVNSTHQSTSTGTAPTAKLIDSSNLINGLLKRHQARKIESEEKMQLEQQQPQQNQRKTVQPQSRPWGRPQSPQEKVKKDPRQGIQWRGEREIQRPESTTPFDETSSSSSPQSPPPATPPLSTVKTKEVKGEEPPEEFPQLWRARPTRPDPPAECYQLSSKTLASHKQQQSSAKYHLVHSYNFIGLTPQQSSKNSYQWGQQQSRLLTMSESSPQQAILQKKFDPSQPQSRSQKNERSELQPPSQSKSLLKKSTKELQTPSEIKGGNRPKQGQEFADWTYPIPLTKVNSMPSNSSSFFTFQTSNTTSTSKFWEEIEEFPDTNHHHRKNNEGVAAGGYENGQLVLEKDGGKDCEEEHNHHFEKHSIEEKREKIEQRRQWQKPGAPALQPKVSEIPESSTPQIPKTSPSGAAHSPRTQCKQPHHCRHHSLESIDEDEISDAFSLMLSLNRDGHFDDTDISSLQMNDSATVYFHRQLQNATTAANANNAAAAAAAKDYWKEKYHKLMEETNRAKELVIQEEEEGDKVAKPGQKSKGATMTEKKKQLMLNKKGRVEVEQVELKEMIYHHDERNAGAEKAAGKGEWDMSLEETDTANNTTNDITQRTEHMEQTEPITNDGERQHRCSSPVDAITQLLETSLDSCDIDRNNNQQQEQGGADYSGGKKGRGLSQKEAEGAKNVNVNCCPRSGLTGEELDWIMSRVQKARGAGVQTSALEMMNFISKFAQEDNNDRKKERRSSSQRQGDQSSCQGRNGDAASKDDGDQVPQCKSTSSVRNVAKDMVARSLLPALENLSLQKAEEGHKAAMGAQELALETIHTEDTNGFYSQRIGHLREDSPTFMPTSPTKETLQPKSLPNVMDEEGGEGNDVALLQRWNKNRDMRSSEHASLGEVKKVFPPWWRNRINLLGGKNSAD